MKLWIMQALMLSVCSMGYAQTAEFIELGDLPGGDYLSVAHDVSADGRFAVGYSKSWTSGQFFSEPFHWSESDGMIGLGFLDGGHPDGVAGAVSPEGSWVVGQTDSAIGYQAFAWSASTGMIGLGDLPGGRTESLARDVSSAGRVVVGSSGSNIGGIDTFEAFVWTPDEGMRGLGVLNGGWQDPGSTAYAVSASGEMVVGGSSGPEGTRGYRWTEQTGMVALSALDNGQRERFSVAHAVSSDGQWIAGNSRTTLDDGTLATVPVRWHPDGAIEQLGFLVDERSTNSRVNAISDDGSTIVGWALGDGSGDTAFIWTAEDGTRSIRQMLLEDYGLDIHDLGWHFLRNATGISADGRTIVGHGNGPNSGTEAWMIRLPVPAPATAAPLLTAAAFAARRRQR